MKSGGNAFATMFLTNAQVFVVKNLGFQLLMNLLNEFSFSSLHILFFLFFRRLQMVLFVVQHMHPFLESHAFFALIALAISTV